MMNLDSEASSWSLDLGDADLPLMNTLFRWPSGRRRDWEMLEIKLDLSGQTLSLTCESLLVEPITICTSGILNKETYKSPL